MNKVTSLPGGTMTGDELRSIRKRLGLTQRKFAAVLGLSDTPRGSYICHMESGRYRVTARTAAQARILVASIKGRG